MTPDLAAVLDGSARWSLVRGEALAVLQSLPDASVDCVACDPPYSSGGMYRGDRTDSTTAKYANTPATSTRPDFAGDNRDQRSWYLWCLLWLPELLRITKPGGVLAVFCDWRQYPSLSDALQVAGWVWRGVAVWDKTEGIRPQPGRFRQQCEFVLWASAGGLPLDREADILPGCYRAQMRQAERYHLTGKPVDVMRWVVSTCERGGLVCDPFSGSGTTGVAALLEGRRFLGVEQSPEYADVARARLAAAAEGSLQPLDARQLSLLGGQP